MGVEVSLDSKGRVLIPARIRSELGGRRFILRKKQGRLVLEAIPEPEKVRGKYAGLIKKDLAGLEEDQERFLRGMG